ncbi:MAG: glutathione transport system permease protein gsiA [Cryptosporangiaceae bacterium]|nr:glutathione transport system permease protein gsiA [Cryptosporangiaceae bacterium]
MSTLAALPTVQDDGAGLVASPPPGRLRIVARRFARNRGALGGLAVVVALFVLAFAGPLLSRWNYADIDYGALRQAPTPAHWWGTNAIGQDVFAQTVRGLQKSLLIGLAVALFSTVLAAVAGATAGYFGGWADRALTFAIDLLLVFPAFLIIAIISPRLRSAGWIAFVGLLAIFGWMISARVIRAMAITLRDREFVRAARFMGVPGFRIILRHILPNTASFLIIDATISVGGAVMAETSLSYFGFGVQRPDVSLGTLIADGTGAALTYPWMFCFSAGLLVVFVLAVNLIGDGLRDAIDPTSVTTSRRRTAPARQRPDRVAADPEAVLEIRGLQVSFGGVPAVRGVDLVLRPGEVLGLVGESGSGKSVTALAAMGLLPSSAQVTGSVRVAGTEVVGAPDRILAGLRGNRVAMVFQDSLSAFNPVLRIADQLAEAIRSHDDIGRTAARARAIELLAQVGIPDAAVRADSFPQELSGGMRQRAMIAMAIANRPDVIVADEPTTALDVTVQAQVLDVLRTAQRETGAALVLVSHDLGVVAGLADRIAVMYAGRVVELAPARALFHQPLMPYTQGLLGALPRIDEGIGRGVARRPLLPIPGRPPTGGELTGGCPFAPRCPLAEDECRAVEPSLERHGPAGHLVACRRAGETAIAAVPAEPPVAPAAGPVVLAVRDLVKTFPLYTGAVVTRRSGSVYAVDGVSLDVRRGETVALVGESGCGKSTTLFEILGLAQPQAGTIELLGRALGPQLTASERRELRAGVQIVFQDPLASLDPRMPVGDIIAEPLRAQSAPREHIARRVPEVLRLVGLDPEHATRYPHEFSGGQRQRIAIARALSVEPELLVLDEPVSALDVSIQASVLNLLQDLKVRLGLAYLFVSHDLAVVAHIADRVNVMYLGRTVEAGPVNEVFARPRHPYTQALLSAVPIPDPDVERTRTRILLAGDPPSPSRRHTGCPFRSRCPVYARLAEPDQRQCAEQAPALVGEAHGAACHFPRPYEPF